MKTRNYPILLLSALGCVGLFSVGVAAVINPAVTEDDAFAVTAMDGLKGVRVRIVQAFSAFERHRFDRDPIDTAELQAQAEHTLRMAGIRVFESPSPDPAVGELVITVNTWPTRALFRCILEVRTQLYQLADLVRANGLRLMTPTWPVGEGLSQAKTVTEVKRSRAERAVEKEIDRQLQVFIADYFAANPLMSPAMTGTVTSLICAPGPHAVGYHRYEILGDNGRHYRPTNLPHEFKQNGLRVWFRFRPIRRHEPYATVEIVEIHTL